MTLAYEKNTLSEAQQNTTGQATTIQSPLTQPHQLLSTRGGEISVCRVRNDISWKDVVDNITAPATFVSLNGILDDDTTF